MMDFNFATAEIPEDVIPNDFGLDLCEKCNTRPKKPYGGRGKHPKYCTECSNAPAKSNGSRVKGTNAALAAQAVQALSQVHNFITLGLMFTQMHQTAGKWSTETAEEKFTQSLYEALLLDPELCKWICRGGVKSGKVALLISYLMLVASVGPVLAAELKEQKEERAKRKAEEEAEEQTQQFPPTIDAHAQTTWAA